jgi:membrane-bound lytic murein transglycosylase F
MLRRFWMVLGLATALAGCGAADDEATAAEPRSLEAIKESGKLVVLTRNAPTTWYINRNGDDVGPEYDKVEAFADSLGVDVEIRDKPTVSAILKGLRAGEGDLAAAGLTVTEQRKADFQFGPAYQDVTQQVVCRRDHVQPESIEDLVGLDLHVIADSSYSQRLAELKANGHPDLEWSERESMTTESLLRAVWQREIDCTVADSTIVDINRRYFPELLTPFNLSRVQSLAWAMPEGSDALAQRATAWLEDFRESGELKNLQERYYGFFEIFDYVDTRVYIRRIDERFPDFRKSFQAAAEKYDLPPLLLAAQGYQESHWNPNARSPTGVRGIMMLTQNTAREMGVTNRLDPQQSINGGAKYLAKMKKRFVDEVTEPDRTFMALAAYNVGRAHMHDAQVLARRMDLSPHEWSDIKQVLPLLADKRYYTTLKYGYARGREPVRYVQRIREYRHVLENQAGITGRYQ